ncbi:GTPase-activating protein skywalker-like [Argopecten irradians]|uniref:GTPase-activating protein skywalker-like n=1 Tax=Argopecten irradians TaxID=31199 RepID=UPI00371822A3
MNTDLLDLISHEELSLVAEGSITDLPGDPDSGDHDDIKNELKQSGKDKTPESEVTAAKFPSESDTDYDPISSESLTKDTEEQLNYDHFTETDVKLEFVCDTKEGFHGDKVLLLPFDETNTSSTDDIEPNDEGFEKSGKPDESIETGNCNEIGLLSPDSDLSLNLDDTGQDRKYAKEEIEFNQHSNECEVDSYLKDSPRSAAGCPSDDGVVTEENVLKSGGDQGQNFCEENQETIDDPASADSNQLSLIVSEDELARKSENSGHLHESSSEENMEKKSTLLGLARGEDYDTAEVDKEPTILIPCVKLKDVYVSQTEVDTLSSSNNAPSEQGVGIIVSETETKNLDIETLEPVGGLGDPGVEGILHEHSSDDETEPKSEDVDVIAQGGTEDNFLTEQDQESDVEGQPEVITHDDEKKVNDIEASVYDHPFVSDVNVESVIYPASCLAKEKKRKRKDSNLKDNEDHMKKLLVSLNLKHLKSFLRTSLWSHDHQMRGLLWQQACKYLHKADGNFFEEMVEELYDKRGHSGEVTLPSFVDFDNQPTYHLNTSGIQSVHKILAVMHHTNPDITYCPILFGLVSVFLHYMTPSEAYNCAYGLLRSKETFIMQTKVSFEATKLVVRDLTKKYAKSSYVNIVRNTKSVDSVFDSWYWWIFKDLPFPYLVCIVDCFILEGIKVFYRAALAIVILYTKHSAKRTRSSSRHGPADSASSLRQFCREFPFRTDKLLRTGFGIRGLTRKHIKKLQLKNEMFINSHHLHPSASSQSMNGHRRANSGPTNIHMEGSSTILTQEMLYIVWSWLPPRFAVCQPELLYTSEEHGTSLMTLYTRVEDYQPTLIVIKTTNNEVFGAFCSTYWRDRKHSTKNLSYFGTGETFIFTLSPKKQRYSWVGLLQEDIPNTANMFLAGDNSMLTVGGGNGEAIQLDANLHHCRTEKCDTFQNEPLCEEQDFTCKVVEVYGFV